MACVRPGRRASRCRSAVRRASSTRRTARRTTDIEWAPPGGQHAAGAGLRRGRRAGARRRRAGHPHRCRDGAGRVPYWQGGPAYCRVRPGYFGGYAISGLLPGLPARLDAVRLVGPGRRRRLLSGDWRRRRGRRSAAVTAAGTAAAATAADGDGGGGDGGGGWRRRRFGGGGGDGGGASTSAAAATSAGTSAASETGRQTCGLVPNGNKFGPGAAVCDQSVPAQPPKYARATPLGTTIVQASVTSSVISSTSSAAIRATTHW